MALYVKNAEVDALAERLATRRGVTKTEAVRRALQNELDRERYDPDLVKAGLSFCRNLLRRAPSFRAEAANKEFIDSLYESE